MIVAFHFTIDAFHFVDVMQRRAFSYIAEGL